MLKCSFSEVDDWIFIEEVLFSLAWRAVETDLKLIVSNNQGPKTVVKVSESDLKIWAEDHRTSNVLPRDKFGFPC